MQLDVEPSPSALLIKTKKHRILNNNNINGPYLGIESCFYAYIGESTS